MPQEIFIREKQTDQAYDFIHLCIPYPLGKRSTKLNRFNAEMKFHIPLKI